jgi:hypothetical protein
MTGQSYSKPKRTLCARSSESGGELEAEAK